MQHNIALNLGYIEQLTLNSFAVPHDLRISRTTIQCMNITALKLSFKNFHMEFVSFWLGTEREKNEFRPPILLN